jgi:hypothetical protein
MLTSIKTLRESSADQSRVTRVANALKKKWPEYTDDKPFPAAFIMISNSQADADWVISSDNAYPTHISFVAGKANAVAKELAETKLPYRSAPQSKADAQKIIDIYAKHSAIFAPLATLSTSITDKDVAVEADFKGGELTKEGFKEVKNPPTPKKPTAPAKAKAAPKPKVAKTVPAAIKAKPQTAPVLTVDHMVTQLQAMKKRDKLAVLRLLSSRTKKSFLVANAESTDSRKPTLVTIVL